MAKNKDRTVTTKRKATGRDAALEAFVDDNRAIFARWSTPRDPARIERIAEKLALAWVAVPDQRLGQLIVNLTGKPDPFNVEDDALERRLDAFLANGETELENASCRRTLENFQTSRRIAVSVGAERVPEAMQALERADEMVRAAGSAPRQGDISSWEWSIELAAEEAREAYMITARAQARDRR